MNFFQKVNENGFSLRSVNGEKKVDLSVNLDTKCSMTKATKSIEHHRFCIFSAIAYFIGKKRYVNKSKLLKRHVSNQDVNLYFLFFQVGKFNVKIYIDL